MTFLAGCVVGAVVVSLVHWVLRDERRQIANGALGGPVWIVMSKSPLGSDTTDLEQVVRHWYDEMYSKPTNEGQDNAETE